MEIFSAMKILIFPQPLEYHQPESRDQFNPEAPNTSDKHLQMFILCELEAMAIVCYSYNVGYRLVWGGPPSTNFGYRIV